MCRGVGVEGGIERRGEGGCAHGGCSGLVGCLLA